MKGNITGAGAGAEPRCEIPSCPPIQVCMKVPYTSSQHISVLFHKELTAEIAIYLLQTPHFAIDLVVVRFQFYLIKGLAVVTLWAPTTRQQHQRPPMLRLTMFLSPLWDLVRRLWCSVISSSPMASSDSARLFYASYIIRTPHAGWIRCRKCPFTRGGAHSQYGIRDYTFGLTFKDMFRCS